MDNGISSIVANNIGAIIMAMIFLYYMSRRDDKFNEVITTLSNKFEASSAKLAEAIDDLREKLQKFEK